jgi:hypothetical protein
MLENSNSRNAWRVVERAVEKWKKLNELLEYVDKKMSTLSEDEVIPIASDKETAALLERFSGDPEIQKGAVEFDHAQKLE